MTLNRPGNTPRYAVLTGGVGGAKLVLGLTQILAAEQIDVIGNTGDDFVHLGLAISPDLDTLMYTLADEVNPETGWGRRDESWNFMEALGQLGGETWFRLGDRDLATHIERSGRIAAGEPLSNITRHLTRQMGIHVNIQPMSDQPVRTRVLTDTGPLEFQHYFVRERATPEVRGLDYAGAATARAAPGIKELLADPHLAAVIIAPSNPWLSIDPILAIAEIRGAVEKTPAPVVAVSPIVGAAAIKGPTAKIMRELGLEVSALSVARHYQDLLDGFILDQTDQSGAEELDGLGLQVACCDTIMKSLQDKERVAQAALDLARTIAGTRT